MMFWLLTFKRMKYICYKILLCKCFWHPSKEGAAAMTALASIVDMFTFPTTSAYLAHAIWIHDLSIGMALHIFQLYTQVVGLLTWPFVWRSNVIDRCTISLNWWCMRWLLFKSTQMTVYHLVFSIRFYMLIPRDMWIVSDFSYKWRSCWGLVFVKKSL